MIRRNLTAAYLRLETWGLMLATWARSKADALLLLIPMAVMVGGLLVASYVTSHALQVAGR